MQQHKLEIKGKTFHKRLHHFRRWRKLIRHAFTGINNRVWKMIKLGLGSMQLLMLQLNGSTPENAHIAARNVADTGRFLVPGISVGF
jgi:hypothetical protein